MKQCSARERVGVRELGWEESGVGCKGESGV